MNVVSYWAIPGIRCKDVPQKLIIQTCLEYYNLEWDNFIAVSRKRDVVVPRQICMFLLREYGSMTFQGIGDLFNRDHTTVIHSVSFISQRQEMAEFKDDLQQLKRALCIP